MTILTLDKIDFKSETVTREKQGHYIMIKGPIHEEDMIINIYELNIRPPKCMKQTLTELKEEIESQKL